MPLFGHIPIFARVMLPSVDQVERTLDDLSRRLMGNERFTLKTIEAMNAEYTALGVVIGQLKVKRGDQKMSLGNRVDNHDTELRAAKILRAQIDQGRAQVPPLDTAKLEVDLQGLLTKLKSEAGVVSTTQTTADMTATRISALSAKHSALA